MSNGDGASLQPEEQERSRRSARVARVARVCRGRGPQPRAARRRETRAGVGFPRAAHHGSARAAACCVRGVCPPPSRASYWSRDVMAATARPRIGSKPPCSASYRPREDGASTSIVADAAHFEDIC